MEDYSDIGPGEGWLYMGGDVASTAEYVCLWLALLALVAWAIREARAGRLKDPTDELFGWKDGKPKK